MTNDDIKIFGNLMDSKFEKFRDDIKEEISGTEKRLKEEITTTVVASEKRIVKSVVDYLSDQLMPMLDEKADKTDLQRFESLPTIAHELKLQREKN